MIRQRIDLLAPPFSGHLNPILAMARALNADYSVRVISTPSVQHRIRQAGIVAVPMVDGWDARLQDIVNPPHAIGSNPLRLHRQFHEVLGLQHQLKSDLVELYRKDRPDLLIADFTLVTAGVVATDYAIPWWTSLPSPCVLETAGAPPSYLGGWQPMAGGVGDLRDSVGRFLIRSFKRSIAFAYRSSIQRAGVRQIYRSDGSEAIYSNKCILVLGLPELEFSEVWPSAAKLIGPMLYTPAVSMEEPYFVEGRQHVLVTLGTHLDWNKDRIASDLRRIAKRMPEVEFHFTDGHVDGGPITTDGNFRRLPFIDYARHIHRYDVVMHHGGSGVMYYCLSKGKPAIVYPVDYDQFDNAARLEFAGVAYRMRSLEQMETLIRRSLVDDELSKKCAAYANILKAAASENALKKHVADFFNESRMAKSTIGEKRRTRSSSSEST